MAKGLRAEWQVGEKTPQCLHLHFHLIFFWPEALCTESIFLTPFPIYYQETAGRKGKYWLECSLCLLADYALHKNGDEIVVCFPFSSVFILSKRVMMVVWCGWGVIVDTHSFPPHNASDPVLSSNTVPSFKGRSLKSRRKVKHLGFLFCHLLDCKAHPFPRVCVCDLHRTLSILGTTLWSVTRRVTLSAFLANVPKKKNATWTVNRFGPSDFSCFSLIWLLSCNRGR